MSLEHREPYGTRAVRFLGIWKFDDFRMKAYSISYAGGTVGPALTRAARRVCADRLGESAGATRHYGVGFVGVHAGRTGDFVFVDWWADENELHHHVYVSEPGSPDGLRYVTPTGLNACVWDLFLIGHERDGWVQHVLRPPAGADLEAYQRFTLDCDV